MRRASGSVANAFLKYNPIQLARNLRGGPEADLLPMPPSPEEVARQRQSEYGGTNIGPQVVPPGARGEQAQREEVAVELRVSADPGTNVETVKQPKGNVVKLKRTGSD